MILWMSSAMRDLGSIGMAALDVSVGAVSGLAWLGLVPAFGLAVGWRVGLAIAISVLGAGLLVSLPATKVALPLFMHDVTAIFRGDMQNLTFILAASARIIDAVLIGAASGIAVWLGTRWHKRSIVMASRDEAGRASTPLSE
ncbi:MAG: hypothetical protein AAFV19_00225 [Pseudomonadota bacterium]